jgi:hypothetical protein
VLRWMVLEKVLRVGPMRSGPYLVAKPSQVGFDVDGISYPLCHPLLVGVGLAYRVFGLGRFFLARSPSFSLGGVAAPIDPYTMIVRPGPELLD